MHKLADDEYDTFPRAAGIIKNHMYVDDLLTSADTIKEARDIKNEVIELFKKGGFTIRQWASNDLRVINDLSDEAIHKSLTLDDDKSLKTIGVSWNTYDDKIYYSAHPVKNHGTLTKRKILSEIARVYDPIGLVGPIVMKAKRLMQDVWRAGIYWDESIPQNIYTEWIEFAEQLKNLHNILVDTRKILVENYFHVQIHGFCNASNVGYGACLYIRSIGKNGKINNKLLCSKSRVVPIKPVTTPRLELCGALLLAKLFAEVKIMINISIEKVVFWCDSTIVLHWIKTAPHLLKTYVANRVIKILELANMVDWKHIRSEDNPADVISRGQLPNIFLQNKLWHEGPSWLKKNENKWYHGKLQKIDIPELKPNTCLVIAFNEPTIFKKYASFSKLCRIVAYCFRFKTKNLGLLCAKEIEEAETRILKILQRLYFSNEIKNLKDARSPYNGKFINLNPFLDDRDLIRVGGRLQMSDLSFGQNHPILLPSQHHLTNKIIRELHEKHFHSGIQTTLFLLRRKFWILDGRNQVRKIIRNCVKCYRFIAKSVEYKMGNLPPARVRQTFPFAQIGIDYCGPFYIKERKYRNRSKIKIYVCVFIYMAVKAIHLEVVNDLSSDGFLTALRRFVARRGVPEKIYSDNGTNFVGANNELKDLYALLNSEQHKKLVLQYASDTKISWHFIPPAAPHFGGLWESTVKIFKHYFKRVVGDTLFTFKKLNTFVIEIEGVLNSRPTYFSVLTPLPTYISAYLHLGVLTSLSSDSNDLNALSPAYCLIGRPITTLPEIDLVSVPNNKLSIWQHIIKVCQDFWSRWNLEYLNELQQRTKWNKDGIKIEVGTMVLIKDKNLPCIKWLLGRIATLHPGEDGTIRAATVKTVHGELKRTTKCLCPLLCNK
ncbi:uncharacterized protein [Cardiocondyla obscurior]|uniref:uncharacterized protein n=1 Tax=Cardiocondyla obscurior TaxID=286306 RepID=UPI0039658940